jgi:hypothetical protein
MGLHPGIFWVSCYLRTVYGNIQSHIRVSIFLDIILIPKQCTENFCIINGEQIKAMDVITIKEWLVPASTAISLLSVAVSIVISLRQYQLKLKEEIRLTYNAQIESDIKLLKLFTEIMNIAHARGESIISDKLLELMVHPEIQAKLSINNRTDFRDAAVITLPVGGAAQDAAIAAICELGKKHLLLRPIALRALESLSQFKRDIALPYFEQLQRMNNG